MIDYNKTLSQDVLNLQFSGIRKFFDIAQQYDDIISLSVGEPDFKTPWKIRKTAISTIEKGRTNYTANSGLAELKTAAADYFKKTLGVDYNNESEIIITVGGSEGIDASIRAIVSQGDEVLIPEPSFVCYAPIVTLTRGIPVPIVMKRENNFRLTADALKEKITDKTKLLILPFPNNPTGAVMRKKDLEEVAEVLKDTNIMVLSDEIYSELTYGDEKHCSIVQIGDMKERTVLINGFSKAFAMTGWRLGMCAAPAPVLTQILKIHQYCIMSSPTISQYAAVTALKECEDDVKHMVSEYDIRRRMLVKGFNDLGLDCFEPEGAFYVFPYIGDTGMTSEEFCEKLIYSKKVAVVPGSAFGKSGEGFIRVSYAYSLSHLSTALSRIKEFLEETGYYNKA